MKRGTMVEVTWLDACNTARWLKPAEADDWHGGARCTTLGYFWKSDKAGITVAQSWAHDEVGALWFIPASMVKRVKKLR